MIARVLCNDRLIVEKTQEYSGDQPETVQGNNITTEEVEYMKAEAEAKKKRSRRIGPGDVRKRKSLDVHLVEGSGIAAAADGADRSGRRTRRKLAAEEAAAKENQSSHLNTQ